MNKIYLFFIPTGVIFAFLIFVFLSPFYNPNNSKYKYDIKYMEHGSEISSGDKSRSNSELLIVPAEIDFYDIVDSCEYIFGIRRNPLDENGVCFPEWCGPEGYFIVDKASSNVSLGVSSVDFERKLKESKYFLVDGGKLYSRYINRVFLSFSCR